jgi:leader peptidase (prepilin peptidase)/N-methyltransferase
MLIAFLLILGAAVGSFLNVCIYRLPRGESIIYPPSHCPACGRKLSVLDLIPFVGYLLLLGRCRYCKARISFRYPLVELLSALGFAYSWATAPHPLDFVFRISLLSVLIVIFFIDLELKVIPDVASGLGIIAGVIYNFLRGGFPLFFSSLFGMVLGFILLFIVARLGEFWFKKEVMGDGDLLMAALLGAAFGAGGMLLSLFLGYLLAAAVALILLALRRLKFGQYIPFGPALAAGGAITLFWGERLLEWYWGLFL